MTRILVIADHLYLTFFRFSFLGRFKMDLRVDLLNTSNAMDAASNRVFSILAFDGTLHLLA
jgi:hypothetical protein